MTGSGTQADPYIIQNITDLQAMEDDLTAYYELGQDIDASATSGWNGGLGFNPVGNWPAPAVGFSGCFDGKGYVITNLFINRPDVSCIGLFGYTVTGSGGWIRNVGLITCNITGGKYTGALVGFHEGGGAQSITSCYSTGIIVGSKTLTLGAVGGLLGYNGSEISGCYSTASVTAASTAWNTEEVGGLIGTNDGDIADCYATGAVTVTSPATRDVSETGGFIGYHNNGVLLRCYSTGNVIVNAGDDTYSIGGFIGACEGTETTSQCFSTGNVTVNAGDIISWIGGFAGYSDIVGISNCYARGTVTVTTASGAAMDGNIGGFIGSVSAGITVLNSYSTGLITITGTFNNVGGFCGNNAGTITACFWDTETSGQATSDGGTGKTTAQMKTTSTFTDVDWDFVTIWGSSSYINNAYPYLRGITPPVEPIVVTNLATNIDSGNSYLSGILTADGGVTCTCGFQWGLTNAYGNTTSTVSLTTGQGFSLLISGLSANTIYHFRAFATNSAGTSYGSDVTFVSGVSANSGYIWVEGTAGTGGYIWVEGIAGVSSNAGYIWIE